MANILIWNGNLIIFIKILQNFYFDPNEEKSAAVFDAMSLTNFSHDILKCIFLNENV